MKRHTLISGLAFACILGAASMLHGQAIPTASRVGSIQAGAGWFLANPDFAQTRIQGLVFYSDLDLAPSYGVEGEFHYSVITPSDVSENIYVAGPRYIVRHKGVNGYAKVLFGAGHFGSQSGPPFLKPTLTSPTWQVAALIFTQRATSTSAPSILRCRSGPAFLLTALLLFQVMSASLMSSTSARSLEWLQEMTRVFLATTELAFF